MNSLDQKNSGSSPLLTAQREFRITLSLSGNPDLLSQPRRMFLVSRSNYTPQPDSPWLRALIAATNRSISKKEVLVCGCERLGYDIPRNIFARGSSSGVILVKHRSEITPPLPANSLTVEFETLDKRDPLPLRDRLVAHFANVASEILVRDAGNMANLAKDFRGRGIDIDSSYRAQDDTTPRSRWPQTRLTSLPFPSWDFLTHFTREPDGEWPDESREDYVNWLCTTGISDRRGDFEALRRILSQKRILGGGRFIRGNAPMVCWTALPPHEVGTLRGWRKGLRRWNFTPYGIAVRKTALGALHARPIRYCSDVEMNSAKPDEAVWMQPSTSGSYDWSLEKEWRSVGDLDLAAIAREDIQVLTYSQPEAEAIQKDFHVKAFATG